MPNSMNLYQLCNMIGIGSFSFWKSFCGDDDARFEPANRVLWQWYRRPQDITYIRNYLGNYFLTRLQMTIRKQILERNTFLHVPLFPIVKMHQLRELFLLPCYNYNYMNYSLANDLRSNFVDHGTCTLLNTPSISEDAFFTNKTYQEPQLYTPNVCWVKFVI